MRRYERWLLIASIMFGAGTDAAAQRGVEHYGGAAGDDFGLDAPRRRRTGIRASQVPEVHRVRRGDTLWDITGYYYGNPWEWPRVWSYNPEITNPHWIYPDDSIRLRGEGMATSAGLPNGTRESSMRVSPARPSARGVHLNNQGFLDRDALDTSGVVAGAPSERMLLSPFDTVYVQFEEGILPEVGATYTVFARLDPGSHEHSPEGELVQILGGVRLDGYDAERQLGRGTIIEAQEPIERGFRMARMDRSFFQVPPRQNEREIEGTVVAALLPRELVSSQQIVFVDVGEEDGVKVGNRFFVLRAEDGWRRTQVYQAERGETIPNAPRPDSYPDEIIAEGRVVNVRPKTSTLLVEEALSEVRMGERAVMRRGF